MLQQQGFDILTHRYCTDPPWLGADHFASWPLTSLDAFVQDELRNLQYVEIEEVPAMKVSFKLQTIKHGTKLKYDYLWQSLFWSNMLLFTQMQIMTHTKKKYLNTLGPLVASQKRVLLWIPCQTNTCNWHDKIRHFTKQVKFMCHLYCRSCWSPQSYHGQSIFMHEYKVNKIVPFNQLKTSPEYTQAGVYGKCVL